MTRTILRRLDCPIQQRSVWPSWPLTAWPLNWDTASVFCCLLQCIFQQMFWIAHILQEQWTLHTLCTCTNAGVCISCDLRSLSHVACRPSQGSNGPVEMSQLENDVFFQAVGVCSVIVIQHSIITDSWIVTVRAPPSGGQRNCTSHGLLGDDLQSHIRSSRSKEKHKTCENLLIKRLNPIFGANIESWALRSVL